MKPKGKLLALFLVFGAIALVTASGAFTSTAVDRTMTVTVANDSAALLGLAPNSTSQNGGYASFTNDRIEITIQDANLDADTHVNHVLNVTNNGESDVDIWVTLSGDNPNTVTLWNGPVQSGSTIVNQGNATTVNSGDTISVSVRIDTRGAGLNAGNNLVNQVTFHAESV
jgi:hypothetical protein